MNFQFLDDLGAPLAVMVDSPLLWADKSNDLYQWLKSHDCEQNMYGGLIMLPSEEVKTLFILEWM